MEETFGGEEENDLESYKNIKERFEGNENALEICRLLLSNLSESQIQWEEKEEEKEKEKEKGKEEEEKEKEKEKEERQEVLLLYSASSSLGLARLVGSLSEEWLPKFYSSLGLSQLNLSLLLEKSKQSKGILNFIENIRDPNLLNQIVSVLHLPSLTTRNLSFCHPEIADELIMRGFEQLLLSSGKELCEQLCNSFLISCETYDFHEMIDGLLEKIFELEPKEKKEKKKQIDPPQKAQRTERETGILPGTVPGKEVWDISKLTRDLNAQTIHTHFNVKDLLWFCKTNGIQQKKKKSEVIRQILKYFEEKEQEEDKS